MLEVKASMTSSIRKLDLYVYSLVSRFFQNVDDCMVYAVGYSNLVSYNVAVTLEKEYQHLRMLTL
jgi:hypothetical protein